MTGQRPNRPRLQRPFAARPGSQASFGSACRRRSLYLSSSSASIVAGLVPLLMVIGPDRRRPWVVCASSRKGFHAFCLRRAHADRDGSRARDRLLALRCLRVTGRSAANGSASEPDAVRRPPARTASRAVLFSGSIFVIALERHAARPLERDEEVSPSGQSRWASSGPRRTARSTGPSGRRRRRREPAARPLDRTRHRCVAGRTVLGEPWYETSCADRS